ncbi:MAG: NAD(P)H dehydrogenase [Denitrovibrio sp.]|nr:MAG: NAD(P)H dehydrogenase [Denitrovibrio sp.]
MKNVLMIVGHSNYGNSLSNKTIADTAKGNTNITVRNLADVSDGFNFNVEEEQKALASADIIVLQFPFHWYALPALFKKWMDDVLQFGFAYGPGGDKLSGKKLVLSFTTGGPSDTYTKDGSNNYTVEEFTAPLIQTAQFCQMEYAGNVCSNGMLYIPDMMGDKDEVTAKAKDHAKRLVEHLESL